MKKIFYSALFTIALFSSVEAQSDFYNAGLLSITNTADTLFVQRHFVNSTAATFTNNGNAFIKGNINSYQATDLAGNGSITLNGSSRQRVYATSALKNVTIQNTSGNVLLDTAASVSGILNFISGKILTDTNTLKLLTGATVTGAAQNTGWVIGKMQKYFSPVILSRVFEVGDTVSYSPITTAFAAITTAGNMIASVSATDHAQINYSGIDNLKSVNRNWILTNNGIVFTTATATFNFLTSDKDAGASTPNFRTALYKNISGWALTSTSNALPNSIQATGLTSFGDFIIGERISAYRWTGDALTSDWHTAKNWLGGVPTNEFHALIPGGLSLGRLYPILNSSPGFTKTITIEAAASLHVNATTLYIAGDIVNTGILNVSAGSVTMNGTSNQVIPAAAFTGNKIMNLTLENNVSLAGIDTLTGSLSVSAGKTFATNNNLILRSDVNGTARVNALPTDASGNATAFITGNVIIERHIPLRKAWRLLSAPVKSTGAPYINAAWQEGLTTASPNPNLYPGYGVHIMGGTVANGFDQSPTNAASIMILNGLTGQFTALPQATTYIPITTYPGYFLYIRGNRSINLMQGLNAAVTSTTLRMKGQINTGNVVSTVTAGGYTVLGNPYPSAIDFETITRSNVKNAFYIWDPKLSGSYGLGGYVTFIWNIGTNTYDATSAVSPLSKYIQSGEAVLISSLNNSTAGTVTIKESDKTTQGDDHVFGRTDGLNQQVRVNLLTRESDGTHALLDGVLTTYDIDNINNVDEDDAHKISFNTENLGLERTGTLLAVERRKTITENDTTFLNIRNLKASTYSLEIVMNNMVLTPGLLAIFKDAYASPINNFLLDLNGTTSLNFDVNADPASYASNRFSIQYVAQGPLPVRFRMIKASKQQKDILVTWDTETEVNVKSYILQRSADASHFGNVYTTVATSQSGGSGSYQYLDIAPLNGINFYRVKSVDLDGSISYSEIVKVWMGEGSKDPAMVVVQELITDRAFSLRLQNLKNGIYHLRLFNATGQLIIDRSITHSEADEVHQIKMAGRFPPGKYQVELTGTDLRLTTSLLKN